MDFQDTTALVTGASTGIGEQFAVRLADEGADLVLVARSEDRLHALADRVRVAHPGRRVDVVVSDLARPDGGAKVAAAVSELGVHVDLLVNNAGAGSHGDFVEEDPGALAGQIQLNVGSLVDLTSRLLPGMIAAGAGGVINVASVAAFQPVPSMAVYGATKAFVLSFTEALWVETQGTGVRVLTLCPGPTETAFFANTGREFLTAGRQSADEVVTTGLRGLDGSGPTVVSGRANWVSSLGYRFVPRRLLAQISGSVVKASA